MPDFDTCRPQESDRPNKLQKFVAASKQHMSAVAGRLRTSALALLRTKSIIRLLGIGGSILLLAVVAVVVTVWAVEPPADHPVGPSADKLDQEIQLKPPPAYELAPDESDASAYSYSCEPEDKGYDPSVCFEVLTDATGARQLASITEDMITNPDYLRDKDYGLVLRVRFLDKSVYDQSGVGDFATLYCFKHKDVAVSALGSALKDKELLGETDKELLGETDNCYLALYRGEVDAELLKPLD
jgi:hypothetical protein